MAAPAEQTETDQIDIQQDGSAERQVPEHKNAEDLNDTEERESTERWHFWDATQLHVHLKNIKVVALLSSIVVYFVAIAAVFAPLEDMTVGNSLYFGVVVATTVGYGDHLPTSDESKIATIFLVLFGLSIVVLGLKIVQDIITSAALAEAHHAGMCKKKCLFDEEAKKYAKRRKAIGVALLDIFFIVMGTFVFGLDLKNHEDSDYHDHGQSHFLDGLYLTVITITTVGFGDLAPLSQGARAFACFLMLVGIPVQVTAFSLIADAVYPTVEEPVRIQKICAFSQDEFTGINDFVEKMRTEGLGNYHDLGQGTISHFEFLCFMLVRNGNGAVSLKNIKTCMHNFEKIDKTNRGGISQVDFGVGASQHSEAHHHVIGLLR